MRFLSNLFITTGVICQTSNDSKTLRKDLLHYEAMPMQYIENFLSRKIRNYIKKNDIFLIFAQNIDCGYTLEPPQRGGSNVYPQSMFWSTNKKNRYTSANPFSSI